MGIPSLQGQLASFAGVGAGSDFPNPFLDVASLSVPTIFQNALRWAEHVWSVFGPYSAALERTISYFLTDIEIGKASDDVRDKWESFHNDTLDTLGVIKNMLRNREVYGNAFASLHVPFLRFLVCPKCHSRFKLSEVHDNKVFNFKFTIPHFNATCPVCKVGSGYTGKWYVRDEEVDSEKKLSVKIWNPHEMQLLHDPYSHEVAYFWRIPEDYKNNLRKGYLFNIERAPLEVIKAVANNQMFRFHKDAIYHMKEPTLAGIYNRGWGIPRVITDFRQIYYVQVLRRQQEAIALDYVVPFRVVTPAPQQGGKGIGGVTDPLKFYSGTDWRAQMNAMIRRRRRDPAAIQVMGLPVQFQMFGADATKMAPRELLDQAYQQLMNDIGTPIELFNGTLQLQAAPVALRLFEATHHHKVRDANAFLVWLTVQVSNAMSWEPVDCNLKRVTVADNIEKQMMAAQLYMSQAISGTTFLGEVGYKWKKEQQQIADEAQAQAQIQARAQEELDQAGLAQQMAKGLMGGQQQGQGQGQAQGGQGGGQGGQPMSPDMMPGPVTQYAASAGANTPQSPEEMESLADSMANDLLGRPESVKDSELRRLKTINKVLHLVVRDKMQQKRNQAKQQASSGGQQAGGQAA